MSKLDDILESNFDMGFIAMDTTVAKQAIKDLMLELIGEDERFRNVYQWQDAEKLNLFRAEIRQKINDL